MKAYNWNAIFKILPTLVVSTYYLMLKIYLLILFYLDY